MKAEKPLISGLLENFFDGMSQLATTVNVVTTAGPAGKSGLTVSAMSSVTADPPTLLICINEQNSLADEIGVNGKFCVNVLKKEHALISEIFAGRAEQSQEQHLASEDWEKGPGDLPCLKDALVVFDCRVTQQIRVGTHMVYFGRIQQTQISEGEPLIYRARNYQEG